MYQNWSHTPASSVLWDRNNWHWARAHPRAAISSCYWRVAPEPVPYVCANRFRLTLFYITYTLYTHLDSIQSFTECNWILFLIFGFFYFRTKIIFRTRLKIIHWLKMHWSFDPVHHILVQFTIFGNFYKSIPLTDKRIKNICFFHLIIFQIDRQKSIQTVWPGVCVRWAFIFVLTVDSVFAHFMYVLRARCCVRKRVY